MARIAAFLVALLLCTGAGGQEGDRAQTWEIGFGITSGTSEDIAGQGGSSVAIDSDIGLLVVGGYNFTDRFALLMELHWATPDYTARLPIDGTSRVESIDGELDVGTAHLKGVYYFSESDFSPYIEVGGGWTRIDTNIANGPPDTACWWDPWWGYMCTSFFETYHDTRTSYSAAFGVRWDLNRDSVLKVSWGQFHLDTESQTEEIGHDVFRADFSWKF